MYKLESLKKRGGGSEKLVKKNGWKISEFDGNCTFTNPRSSMNTKHENHEKNHTKAHHHQIVESRDKEKNLKISQRKKGTLHTEE